MIKTNSRAFTLTEIILVVAVVGILATVIFASFSKARERSRDSTRVSAIEQIDLALTLYRNTYGTHDDPYPEGTTGSTGVLQELVDKNLIDEIPKDPSGNGTDPVWSAASTDLEAYYYWSAGNAPAGCGESKYVLWYHLENDTSGNTNATCGGIHPGSYVIVR